MVLSSADNFSKSVCLLLLFFLKNLSGISVECQAVWIQIMPDVLSSLIWVQIVCKGYQQTTLVSKEFMTTVKQIRELTRNSESGIYIKLKKHQIFPSLSYFADKLCQQQKPSSG